MNFPEKVTFRFVDQDTKEPVRNIAASLILYAHKKNNYYVGPKITDSDGIVSFDKNECVKEISSSKKFYLMDYLSTLEECLPRLGLKIKPKQELLLAIKKMRQSRDIYSGYWDCSDEFLNALAACDNSKYVSKIYDFSESDLWQNKILEIALEKNKV